MILGFLVQSNLHCGDPVKQDTAEIFYKSQLLQAFQAISLFLLFNQHNLFYIFLDFEYVVFNPRKFDIVERNAKNEISTIYWHTVPETVTFLKQIQGLYPQCVPVIVATDAARTFSVEILEKQIRLAGLNSYILLHAAAPAASVFALNFKYQSIAKLLNKNTSSQAFYLTSTLINPADFPKQVVTFFIQPPYRLLPRRPQLKERAPFSFKDLPVVA